MVTLIIFGGAMAGVFSVGVLTPLQNMVDQVSHIYGISAGAHSGAYYLIGKCELGSEMYIDKMSKHLILNGRGKFLKIMFEDIKNSRKEMILDLDYLKSIEKQLGEEEFNKIKSKLRVRVIDIKTGKLHWIDANDADSLLATSNMLPFSKGPIDIDGNMAADGYLLSDVLDDQLREIIAANEQVIIIMNTPINKGKVRTFFANTMWTLMLIFNIKKPYVLRKLRILSNYRELSRLPDNVTIVQPDYEIDWNCTDKEKIRDFYKHGIEKGKIMAAKMKAS
jgi:predicted acylesterase/phospholipase RssA